MQVGVAALAAVLSLSFAQTEDVSVARWRGADAATQSAVLALARRAFDAYATRREVIDPPASLPPLLRTRAGVFVSAMRHGAPRCCMGTLYPMEASAAQEIVASAVAAAGRDRRFPPVRPGELRGLTLIVSIVGKPRPITPEAVAALDPVRDGLAVRAGSGYGVVLSGETTQVARMVQWGRIRAGAGPNDPVELFRLDVVRFLEKK
jgi:hypothetical protein